MIDKTKHARNGSIMACRSKVFVITIKPQEFYEDQNRSDQSKFSQPDLLLLDLVKQQPSLRFWLRCCWAARDRKSYPQGSMEFSPIEFFASDLSHAAGRAGFRGVLQSYRPVGYRIRARNR